MTNRYRYIDEKGEQIRRQKISDSLKEKYKNGTRKPVRILGDKNWNWKGDKVGYHAIHNWIKRTLGTPETCEGCGKSGVTSGQRNRIHWANKSGKYKRDRNDWMNLCMSCHMLYDFKTGQRRDKRSV